ncbi:DUF3617 family protein [Paraburkholderia sp. BL10I2N1]|uniref:DUF3617 domain-containing protein n=1 Tax=Paraburkholderia sp. BL10I2N1 TaxID=1938796 RepID=UPI001061DBDE|nr:DUF3617 family protein [Paraburkholderia sp. BL10I2N1]TDN58950.1 uncharacterized protein DUF3617 [Paraburkholderia sp. BL10I2N1]
MALPRTRSLVWLAIAVQASASAQVPVKPGKWELTGAFQGLPFGGSDERVRTACISESALGSIPEKALMDAAPQPTDDVSKPRPKCEYSNVRRDGAQSSWMLACEGPTMSGSGKATATPEQLTLSESFDLKMPFGSRSIQHTVRARRLGDCS